MTKKESDIITKTLSNGVKLEFDKSKATGHALIKAREIMRGGYGTIAALVALCSTFDGEIIPPPEVLNMGAAVIMELETLWIEQSPAGE
ncbi:MAG: hypothetical protein LUE64_04380 [Candidatus Gastranaerophilales bacterium]|nr:hypothetical protein [Candidatus Gastranaerophilales bacterium]